MKTYATLTVSALIVAVTMDSASALQKYCEEIPNGETACNQETGHKKGSLENNAFGTAFSKAGYKWTKELCNQKFAGDETVTNGAVFGDPCCIYKKGDKPQFEVTKLVDGSKVPDKENQSVCPTGSGNGSTSSAPGAETNTKGETSETETNTKSETSETETNTKSETPETETNTKSEAVLSSSSNELGEESATTPPAETSLADGAETQVESGVPPSTPAAGKGCAAKGARKLRS